MTKHESENNKPNEREIDQTVEDSFPASDPPSHSGATHIGGHDDTQRASHTRNDAERPKGHPNSDRHATETAYRWEHEEKPSDS